jgi:dienelactone hydrolase
MNELSKAPYDFKKFGFIGESAGGVAALWLGRNYLYSQYAQAFNSPARVEPNAIVSLFPGCEERNQSLSFNSIPTFILSGELDNNSPPVYCQSYTDWVNKEKGGNITLQVLPGQYHDYDAPYPLMASKRAQNPAQCVSEIRGNVRTWDLNGEQFLNDAQGIKDYYSKCMQSASQNPVMSGHTGNPKTGFKEWSDFFVKTLKN